MLSAFINVFRIPDLRAKVLFTLLMLGVYRIGFYVPLPGIDQSALSGHLSNASTGGGGAAERLAETFAMFTGGDLGQSTIFGLGIMPYISASIILQILTMVYSPLEKLAKEGEPGRRKIQEYTRYGTVVLSIFQAVVWVNYLKANGLVYPDYDNAVFAFMAVFGMVAGTMLLMWIGEQIDEYGVGSGISLIIMAGIISQLPVAVIDVAYSLNFSGAAGADVISGEKVVFLVLCFIGVVAASILITQAQRRIPIQQAKQTRGRRVVGGAKQYIPLKINHGGVMPIIFASSFLMIPSYLFGWLSSLEAWPQGMWFRLSTEFLPGEYTYEVVYIGLVYLFAYFWVSVQFRPKELSENLRDHGSFIPGLRPGKRTADYLESVMERITFVGAGFLALIAVIPSIIATQMQIPWRISMFLGGTGLLIVVSVALDLVNRLEVNLVMRNYKGFLDDDSGPAARVKGR